MTEPAVDEYVARSLASLKDFQRATVDVVFDNLFNNGQRRMLVADEVGLGKTIVAKGVIARRIQEKIDSDDNEPLKVTYICSNQIIAHENVGKLDIYPKQQSYDRFASRLTYLALEPEGDPEGMLRLNTLTPATSFNKGSNTGRQDERKILYTLLMAPESALSSHAHALACMLRVGVTRDIHDWANNIESERVNYYEPKLRANCARRFIDQIKETMLPYSPSPLFNQLGTFSPVSLYEAVSFVASLLTFDNFEEHRKASDYLVSELKDALSELCVDYIDADLYILDEFQRFKELVSVDSGSEAAEIAHRIFNKERARILLLSATPFKAFSGDTALESGEENYKEFRKVLTFLMNGDGQSLDRYEQHRQALFKQLLELGDESEAIDTTHRDAVEDVLRSIMCRTERLSVSEDFNAMTVDKWRETPLPLSSGDIQNFVATDNIVRRLNESQANKRYHLHAPIEFCKSAPYPLSFLDDYKLKRDLKRKRDDPVVRQHLLANPSAWIDHKKVHDYLAEMGGDREPAASAKLNQVLDEVLSQNGERMLWVPPSLPYYPLSGDFKESYGFSKTLIFSAWLMVPRMLSSLISYEVERRTIGNPDSLDRRQEKEERKYFHQSSETRHPIPQLVFTQKRSDSGESPNNMTNFALLYPSRTLMGAFDPVECLIGQRPLPEIRREVSRHIQDLIDESELERFGSPSGEQDKWYWAAPLLLDRRTPSLNKSVKGWLESKTLKETSAFFDQKKDQDSSKSKHFDELIRCFHDPNSVGLGSLPEGLADALADMAIAGPAIVALRSLSNQFSTDFEASTTFAFEVANEFVSLFNKPESIAAVRLGTERAPYWRRVLQYCVDGCLQAVLDEFFHVLKPDCATVTDLKTRLVDSMNLPTTSIKVDDLDSFLQEERRNMRCHYAVDLGNQRVDTEEGEKRIKGIRRNFNSPFRPFVLATTSIGQEGLDFHQYCRKIVHWNLPGNPIDLEQREGRINRFKGLVIRQQIASKYRQQLAQESESTRDVWDELFDIADQEEREGTGKCQLIPFWHVEADHFQIERIIPFFPFSRDRAKLASLLKTLAVYRLAFGQPRQAELVEHLLMNVPESKVSEIREKLMIDLSPIRYLGSRSISEQDSF